jgi:hypothetical protein
MLESEDGFTGLNVSSALRTPGGNSLAKFSRVAQYVVRCGVFMSGPLHHLEIKLALRYRKSWQYLLLMRISCTNL